MMFFLLHVGLTNLTLLNILVGVICAVIQDATDSHKDRSHLKKVKEMMLKQLESIDQNNDNMISPEEYRHLIAIPEVVDFLEEECAIDPRQLVLMGETLFYDRKNPGTYKELTFGSVLKAILSLRHGQSSKAVDLMVVQRDIKFLHNKLNAFQQAMNARQETLDSKVDRLNAGMERLLTGMPTLPSPARSTSNPLESNESLILREAGGRGRRHTLQELPSRSNSVRYREPIPASPVA